MVLTHQQHKFKLLLEEAITLLCKSSLPYKMEASVEALIGVTLDSSDVFLISIKESFDNKADDGGIELVLDNSNDMLEGVDDEDEDDDDGGGGGLVENDFNGDDGGEMENKKDDDGDDYNNAEVQSGQINDINNMNTNMNNNSMNQINDDADRNQNNSPPHLPISNNKNTTPYNNTNTANTSIKRTSNNINTLNNNNNNNNSSNNDNNNINNNSNNICNNNNNNSNNNNDNGNHNNREVIFKNKSNFNNNIKESKKSNVNINNNGRSNDNKHTSPCKIPHDINISESPQKKRRRNNSDNNNTYINDNNTSLNENENYININHQQQHATNDRNNYIGYGKNADVKISSNNSCHRPKQHQQQQQPQQQHCENHLNNLTEFICGNLAEIKNEIFDDNVLSNCFNDGNNINDSHPNNNNNNILNNNNSNKMQSRFRSNLSSNEKRISTYLGHNNPHINVKVEKFLSPNDITGNGINNYNNNNGTSLPPNLNPTQISMATDILNISGAFVNIGSAKAFQHSLRTLTKSQLSEVINNMSLPPSNAYSVGLLCTEGVSRVFYKIPPTMIKQEALEFYNLDFYTYNNLYYNSVRVPHNIRDPEDWKVLIAMKNPFTYNGTGQA